jgi:hypothetical protein
MVRSTSRTNIAKKGESGAGGKGCLYEEFGSGIAYPPGTWAFTIVHRSLKVIGA